MSPRGFVTGILCILSTLLSFIAAQSPPTDTFTYPPTFAAVGDYSDDLQFSVGRQMTLTWKSVNEGKGASGDKVTVYLMQDDDDGTCNFQAAACCEPIVQSKTTDPAVRNRFAK